MPRREIAVPINQADGANGTGHPAGKSVVASHNSLFRKYFLALYIAVLVPLLANGISEAWLGYRDQRTTVEDRLRAEADWAAGRIDGFLGGIVDQLGWMTHLPATPGNLEQRRFDALRLLRQVPAITDVVQVDADGKEQIRVSRLALDVVGSGTDRSAEPAFVEPAARKAYFGPVYFRRDSEPYMVVAVTGPRRNAGVVIADVSSEADLGGPGQGESRQGRLCVRHRRRGPPDRPSRLQSCPARQRSDRPGRVERDPARPGQLPHHHPERTGRDADRRDGGR